MKPVQVGNLPQELRDLNQWVGWRYEERDGKSTKVPINPATGHRAKSDSPATWGSIQRALIATETYGLDGIGFVFSETDEYTGIDLDKCLDPTTGKLEPWARRWVAVFNSYTEISPSGTGLHIFIKGKMSGKGRKKGHFEAYSKGRFFTVTGEIFDGNGRNSIQAG